MQQRVAHLEAEICLPQTYKIIFGGGLSFRIFRSPLRGHTLTISGCHDNGYVTNLRSQITAGLKHKLILLPTYTEVAAGIAELDLPALNIPELFLTQKISLGLLPSDQGVLPGLGHVSPPLRPRSIQATTHAVGLQNDEKPDTRTGLADGPDASTYHPPSSYSSAVNTGQKRPSMLDMDSASSHGTDDSDEVHNYYTTKFNGTRRINPNIVSTM
jgi:hypothetical protein